MGRARRLIVGGIAYHVLNRGNARMAIFERDGDFMAFEKAMAEAVDRFDMRLCAYCLMPNHWHLLLWPREGRGEDLSRFTGWLTLTHTQRWHAHRGSAGSGHVYQGRFRSFPVQSDEHFLTVARYIERNPLRANLARRAEEWRWSSLWQRERDDGQGHDLLAQWPVERWASAKWLRLVNQAQSEQELEAIRRSIQRGRPFGSERWTARTTRELGLESTFRSMGRPRKKVATDR